MVNLHELTDTPCQAAEITSITVDSRAVQPGSLFAALPGATVDGRAFIDDALKAGAVALLVPEDSDLDPTLDCYVLKSANPRKDFARIAARFYQKQPSFCCAVTGTNGKSSTVTFARQLWTLLGVKGASLGTLGVTAPDVNIEGGLTTPDAAGLHKTLRTLADANVSHLALEASSHGLDQYRLDGVQIKVAAFTNLSRDHLDYHPTMQAYFGAKKRLFTDLLVSDGYAVLNTDIPEFFDLQECLNGQEVISYGKNATDIQLISATPKPSGQHLVLKVYGETFEIDFPHAGYFQVENAMCALGIVIACGFNAKAAVPLLEKLEGVPGRLEHISHNIFVDYAHTPDALETAIHALRPHCDAKMRVVFGCGGNRDKGKRAEMGKIACQHGDVVYVTDDNPRNEDPKAIRAEIMNACQNAIEIGDRKDCIKRAINDMEKGDLLLIAGKGHENYQIIGETKIHFDDREIVREVCHG